MPNTAEGGGIEENGKREEESVGGAILPVRGGLGGPKRLPVPNGGGSIPLPKVFVSVGFMPPKKGIPKEVVPNGLVSPRTCVEFLLEVVGRGVLPTSGISGTEEVDGVELAVEVWVGVGVEVALLPNIELNELVPNRFGALRNEAGLALIGAEISETTAGAGAEAGA